MSRIRFKGTTSNSILTPPQGRASLYFDEADNSLKLKLDTGEIVALGVSETYIQEISSQLFSNSTSLSVIKDSSGNITSIDLAPGIIGDSHINKISPTKIIDDKNGRFQSTLITDTQLPQNIFSMNCNMDGTWLMELKVTNRRLGGLSGSPGDGATFIRIFRIKSIGSLVTIHDYQSDYTSKDNKNNNLVVSVNSTDIMVTVIGAANNNLKWNAEIISCINI